MAKKKEPKQSGEQLDLIDVSPKNTKPILAAARLYKKFQGDRIAALKEEVTQKQKVLALVREAKLQPLEGGKIMFTCDGVEISVTPRDELLSVKEKTEDAA